MDFKIRPYHPSDLTRLYHICLLTGNNGQDASPLYKDPDLLGHYYAAPYAVFEPELCFVLTQSGMPCGFILGARDTAAFATHCEQAWFPPLRERYPLPDPNIETPTAQIIRAIHTGIYVDDDLADYPAHLHIDLLPEAQGKKLGTKLMDTFLNQLRALNVPALHLGVSRENPGAIKFYERVGFHKIKTYKDSIAFGMHLQTEQASP